MALSWRDLASDIPAVSHVYVFTRNLGVGRLGGEHCGQSIGAVFSNMAFSSDFVSILAIYNSENPGGII